MGSQIKVHLSSCDCAIIKVRKSKMLRIRVTASEREPESESSVLGTSWGCSRQEAKLRPLWKEGTSPLSYAYPEEFAPCPHPTFWDVGIFKDWDKSRHCSWIRLLLRTSLCFRLGMQHSLSAQKRRFTTPAFCQGWVVTESQESFIRNETITVKRRQMETRLIRSLHCWGNIFSKHRYNQVCSSQSHFSFAGS